MAADEQHPGSGPADLPAVLGYEDDDGRAPGGAGRPADQDQAARDEPASEDRPSWQGCLWLVVIPGIILTAVVITLNYLGC